MIDIADPRVFPEHIDAVHAPLVELAAASLAASSSARADEIDDILVKALAERIGRGDGLLLAELFAAAPSAALARHLWRWLIAAWREASRAAAGEGVAATLFALPVVIVAGSQPGAAALALSGILQDCDRIAAILHEHGALAGNRTFALASALATADAVDVPRLPTLLGWQRQALASGGGGRATKQTG